MPVFTNFSDILPDPNNKIDAAGVSSATGSAGPGFASVKFRSSRQVQMSRTISGRGVTASPGYHTWEFDINYNPLTRAEFEPVSTFLESREGRLRPFFVILPQHRVPQNSLFATYAAANSITAAEATSAGSTTLLISGSSMLVGTAGSPSPGDFINIVDSANTNHVKSYKITRVETNSDHRSGTTQPTTSQRRIHVMPPLARSVSSGSVIRFIDPRFRVIQKGDTLEYDLNTDNLYQFSVSVEELLP